MPRTATLLGKLRAGGVAAVVSGAGPTVLALVRADQVEQVLDQAPGGWEAQLLSVTGGATAEGFRP
jgi:homoserine kinase